MTLTERRIAPAAAPEGPRSSRREPCPYPRVVDALLVEFGAVVDPSRIEDVVAREAGRVADAPVRAFLEVLVHKAARRDLAKGLWGEPTAGTEGHAGAAHGHRSVVATE